VSVLKRNPVLFLATFCIALLGTAMLVAQEYVRPDGSPLLWSLGSFLGQFVSLFFVAGAYAMAAEGLDGETKLATLVSGGKDNYLSLLGATILLVLIMIVSFVVVVIVGLVGLLGVGASPVASDTSTMLLAFGVLYLLGFLPIFFLQFYGPAVVVSDASAYGSLKRSFGLVRRNFLATLGFDVVAFVLGLVSGLPTVWLYVTQFDSVMTSSGTYSLLAGLDGSTVAAYLVSSLVLSTLFGGFLYAYQVAFYGDLVERTARDGGEDSGVAFDAADADRSDVDGRSYDA
jgi:hypothetical protein